MMPPTTQSLTWTGLAILAYGIFLYANPWAGAFRRGFAFCKRWPRFWLLIGLVAAQQVWWQARGRVADRVWPSHFSFGNPWEHWQAALLEAADSLVRATWMPIPAEPISVLLAPLFLLNLAGTGGALWRGCQAVMGAPGKWLAIAFFVSATARIAWFGLSASGRWPLSDHFLQALDHVGSLWSGASIAFALAWFIRFSETSLRAPEELLLIHWPTSAAGRIPRLWPTVLSGMVLHFLPESWKSQPSMQILTVTLFLLAGFFPLLLVHWRELWGWRRLLLLGFGRLRDHAPRLLWWVLVAFTHFAFFHLARRIILHSLPAYNLYTLAAQSLLALLHGGLQTWMLVSWISLQPPFSENESTPGMEPLVEKKIHASTWERISQRVRIRRSQQKE